MRAQDDSGPAPSNEFRCKMKKNLILSFLVILAGFAHAETRPNILLIMADDMGFSDIGCYGGEIATPNLDALAKGGVRFTQFYNGARCCPTRAQLLTGLYAHQAGIGFMEPTNAYNKPFKHIPEYQGFLNRRCVTLAEVLKSAGYQTFMCGKWHVGSAEGERPLDRGFDRFFGIHGGASSFFHPKPGQIMDGREPLAPLPEDFYTTDYFAKYAAKFVREAKKDSPFFLYLAFTAPHWPLHAWPEDIAKYRGKYQDGWQKLREERFVRQKQLGIVPQDAELSPLHESTVKWKPEDAGSTDMDLRMAVYAAMIDRMDQGIGQVLAALRETSRFDNTLILFLSDNGACAESIGKGKADAKPADDPHSFQGVLLPWANASATPYRQFKHWTHEGGIATPLIAHWPTGMASRSSKEKSQIVHTPAHIIDIMATCSDLAGAAYPKERDGQAIHPMEGASLKPLLEGSGELPARTLFWEHEGNRAVRSGQWKLVAHYNENLGDEDVALGKRTGRWELYNLERDRTELHNLADQHPDIVTDLAAQHAAWEKRVGARDWESLLKMGGLDVIKPKP
jgi:arylsulfatase A-like enzyme